MFLSVSKTDITGAPAFALTGLTTLTGTPSSQTLYLANPQAMNAYSYSTDNPVAYKDPSGKAFGVDDAAGFIGGAIVGTGIYFGTSIAAHQALSWSGVAGSAVTGGIIGWGAVNTPETLGASNALSAAVITGLIGGYYGDLTKQGIDVFSGKQAGGINYTEAQTAGLYTAGTNWLLQGVVQDAQIPGLSSGRNSMKAIGESIRTKTTNSTISSISVNTAIKSAIGSQVSALYRSFTGGILDTIKLRFTNSRKQ